jgi:hypothetical protein
MTKAEKREVLLAIAKWEPSVYALSIDRSARQRAELRDEIAIALAPVLGLGAETAMNQMQALRMGGGA